MNLHVIFVSIFSIPIVEIILPVQDLLVFLSIICKKKKKKQKKSLSLKHEEKKKSENIDFLFAI